MPRRFHSLILQRKSLAIHSMETYTVSMMGYSAKAVANYFLSKYRNTGIPPLKIQKLVYIAHGWHWAHHDQPLVGDEYAEAWEYGPVYASLYHEFKYRGDLPIIELARDIKGLKRVVPKIEKDDKQTPKLLDKIWEKYGGASGTELSALCHQPGTPWDKARQKADGRRKTHIDEDDIRQHYLAKKKLNQDRNQKNHD